MIGSRLRQLRQARGLTQEDLAERVNMSTPGVNRYEREKTEADLSIVIRLARELETSSDYLLGLTDDPRPPGVVSDLSETERAIVAAVRRRDLLGAIRLIVGSE